MQNLFNICAFEILLALNYKAARAAFQELSYSADLAITYGKLLSDVLTDIEIKIVG